MLGTASSSRYALALDCDDPYRLADDVLLPLETVPSLRRWRPCRPRGPS